MNFFLKACISINSLGKFKKTTLRNDRFRRSKRIVRGILDFAIKHIKNFKIEEFTITKLCTSAKRRIKHFLSTNSLSPQKTRGIDVLKEDRVLIVLANESIRAQILTINNKSRGGIQR